MVIPCLCLSQFSSCTVHHKTAVIPVDIPTHWEPRTKQQQRVAFADFSSAPWQGFEKSERCPNNSSLFQPQAAVVVVALGCLLPRLRRGRAVRVLYRPALTWVSG